MTKYDQSSYLHAPVSGTVALRCRFCINGDPAGPLIDGRSLTDRRRLGRVRAPTSTRGIRRHHRPPAWCGRGGRCAKPAGSFARQHRRPDRTSGRRAHRDLRGRERQVPAHGTRFRRARGGEVHRRSQGHPYRRRNAVAAR